MCHNYLLTAVLRFSLQPYAHYMGKDSYKYFCLLFIYMLQSLFAFTVPVNLSASSKYK